MNINYEIKIDGVLKDIDCYERQTNIDINTQNDVCMIKCFKYTIQNVSTLFMQGCIGASYPTRENIEKCRNVIVVNDWNVEVHKCTANKMEVLKKHTKIELVGDCSTLKQIVFKDILPFAPTVILIARKGSNFTGTVENVDDVRFEDIQENINWIFKNLDNFSEKDLIGLANIFHNAKGVDRHQEVSFKCAKAAADLNSVEGNYKVAYCYLLGQGVDKNDDLAFKHCKFAADLGFAKAQHLLHHYLHDKLVEYEQTRQI